MPDTTDLTRAARDVVTRHRDYTAAGSQTTTARAALDDAVERLDALAGRDPDDETQTMYLLVTTNVCWLLPTRELAEATYVRSGAERDREWHDDPVAELHEVTVPAADAQSFLTVPRPDHPTLLAATQGHYPARVVWQGAPTA